MKAEKNDIIQNIKKSVTEINELIKSAREAGLEVDFSGPQIGFHSLGDNDSAVSVKIYEQIS